MAQLLLSPLEGGRASPPPKNIVASLSSAGLAGVAQVRGGLRRFGDLDVPCEWSGAYDHSDILAGKPLGKARAVESET